MRDDHPDQLVESCDDYPCNGIQHFPNVEPHTDDYERRTLVSECTECGMTRNVSTKARYLTLRFRITR